MDPKKKEYNRQYYLENKEKMKRQIVEAEKKRNIAKKVNALKNDDVDNLDIETLKKKKEQIDKLLARMENIV